MLIVSCGLQRTGAKWSSALRKSFQSESPDRRREDALVVPEPSLFACGFAPFAAPTPLASATCETASGPDGSSEFRVANVLLGVSVVITTIGSDVAAVTFSYSGNFLAPHDTKSCVTTSLAWLMRSRVAISSGAKLSATDTTAAPAQITPRYVATDAADSGASIATESPGPIPPAVRALATRAISSRNSATNVILIGPVPSDSRIAGADGSPCRQLSTMFIFAPTSHRGCIGSRSSRYFFVRLAQHDIEPAERHRPELAAVLDRPVVECRVVRQAKLARGGGDVGAVDDVSRRQPRRAGRAEQGRPRRSRRRRGACEGRSRARG